jgi:hypothetical protein
VQAQWGYSEIVDGTNPAWYDNGRDINSLRDKRRNGIPFDELSKDERYNIAFQCVCVRVNLMIYMVGIEAFNLVKLNRVKLGRLYVHPNVWRDSGGRFHLFSHYIGTKTDEPNDARTLVIDKADYRAPTEPIIVGRSYEYPMMIDGYHRAALFWKFGPAHGELLAYIPQGMPWDPC